MAVQITIDTQGRAILEKNGQVIIIERPSNLREMLESLDRAEKEYHLLSRPKLQ